MDISLGMIIGVGEVLVGAFTPGSGRATKGLIRIGRSVLTKQAMTPMVENVGSALGLDGSTVGELVNDLYLNKTNYAELADIYPF